MAATSSAAISYLRFRGDSSSGSGTKSGAVSFISIRSLSGAFAGNGIVSGTDLRNKKRWKPMSGVPLVKVTDPKTGQVIGQGIVEQAWDQFFDFLGEKKLGGANAHTLPQVESLITRSEAESLVSNAIAANTAQWMAALAQSLAAVREVVVAAALPGAAQIPPIVLQPADPPSPPVTPISPGGE